MIVYDPLYGRFQVPPAAFTIVQTPEFRRLSQIRLLNTISPTLATLGEIRRYSHTLGVVYLESLWEELSEPKFSRQELDAFQTAIILHDIGTPPFGHLFEYILKEQTGWNHEAVIVEILHGRHAPENTAHQFYAARTLKVIKELEKAKVDMAIVLEILTNKHRLSQLILGRLDFDNVDNVARMGWALGMQNGAAMARALAPVLGVTADGRLACAKRNRQPILDWMNLRRSVYDVLVFDAQTVGAQAILTKAIKKALQNRLLTSDDWNLTDEELLARLQGSALTKDLVNQQYLGVLPRHVVTMQISKDVDDLGFSSLSQLNDEIERLAETVGIKQPIAYLFRDRGTFEKSLELVDPESSQTWRVGSTSKSLVIYLFSQSQSQTTISQLRRFIEVSTGTLKIDDTDIIRVSDRFRSEKTGKQASLNF